MITGSAVRTRTAGARGSCLLPLPPDGPPRVMTRGRWGGVVGRGADAGDAGDAGGAGGAAWRSRPPASITRTTAIARHQNIATFVGMQRCAATAAMACFFGVM